jgi:hypothetical protein
MRADFRMFRSPTSAAQGFSPRYQAGLTASAKATASLAEALRAKAERPALRGVNPSEAQA